MLHRLRLEVTAHAHGGDRVSVATWPRQFGRLVARAHMSNQTLPASAIQAFEDTRAHPWAQVGAAREGLQFWDPAHSQQIEAWVTSAAQDLAAIQQSSADYGQFLLVQGVFHLLTENPSQARTFLERSLQVWPDPSNVAGSLLQSF